MDTGTPLATAPPMTAAEYQAQWRARLCVPVNGVCADGLPVQFVLDAACPDGLCGWSCRPGRWRS